MKMIDQRIPKTIGEPYKARLNDISVNWGGHGNLLPYLDHNGAV